MGPRSHAHHSEEACQAIVEGIRYLAKNGCKHAASAMFEAAFPPMQTVEQLHEPIRRRRKARRIARKS